MEKGYNPRRIIVSTEQALSVAGYPGVASLDILDNIVPYINGEDEKTEKEPLKIFGKINNGKLEYAELKISATCTGVPVSHGHSAIVNLEFADKKPKSLEEAINILDNFVAEPQKLNLPFAPKKSIIYRFKKDSPQPLKDRDNEKGMAVSVGRLRKCNVLDIKFIGLSHNTIRGAVGVQFLQQNY